MLDRQGDERQRRAECAEDPLLLLTRSWGDVSRLGIDLFERGLAINLAICVLGGGLLYLNARNASQAAQGRCSEVVTGSPATGKDKAVASNFPCPAAAVGAGSSWS